MALREEFERSGNRLFHLRSYIPLVAIGVVLLALREYQYPGHSETLDHWWEVFCLVVSFFGLAIRVHTIGHTPTGTSGRNARKQRASVLNTSGLYSVVRNPLYLGNFFMGLGITLFAHLWWLSLLYILAFWLYYERIIFAEEAFLREKFGSAYLEWTALTPVFIPRFTGYQKPQLPFSLRNVLKREYNGFFAVILVMFLLETIGDLIVEGKLDFDPAWTVTLSVSFAIWLTLRMLKRHTNVLKVAGR